MEIWSHSFFKSWTKQINRLISLALGGSKSRRRFIQDHRETNRKPSPWNGISHVCYIEDYVTYKHKYTYIWYFRESSESNSLLSQQSVVWTLLIILWISGTFIIASEIMVNFRHLRLMKNLTFVFYTFFLSPDGSDFFGAYFCCNNIIKLL